MVRYLIFFPVERLLVRHAGPEILETGQMSMSSPYKYKNIGGILTKSGWTWEGRLPLLFKDYIDRRFMRAFQLSKELEEET